MPEFTRQLPATNDIVVSGGQIGIDGSVFKLDVLVGELTLNSNMIDDTGPGDAYLKWLTPGNAWLSGRLALRGWLIGDNTALAGITSVGAGTELDVTLTLMDTHTVAGKFVNQGMKLGNTKRSKRPIALWGMFSNVSETNS